MAGRPRSDSEKSRKRRRRRKLALRVFTVAVLAVVIATGVAVGGKIVRPVRLWVAQRSQVNKQSTKLEALKAENSELKAKKKYLESQSGAEAGARMMGYVKPGEVSVVVDSPKSDSKK